jgi:ribosomal protein S18 acetylase RimI-like enzyme
MTNIEIRKVLLLDLNKLQDIGRKTFIETFSEENTEEDMRKYLEEEFSSDKLTNELNNQYSEFYFAEFETNVIGYLKVNYAQAQTEIKDKNSLEIERIYVSKEYHGKKIGQILVDKALQIAKQNTLNYLWLGVWEKNTRAIHFYKKNGFVEFDKHIFKLGNDEQIDIMMKLELNQKG